MSCLPENEQAGCGFAFAVHDPDKDEDNQPDGPAADSPEHREREQGADIRASLTCEGSGDNLRCGDQYADAGEDKEEAHERCQGEEQGRACNVGGAEEV